MWAHLGEKPTAYYLNLEKRQEKDKTLSTILLGDGHTKSDPAVILENAGYSMKNFTVRTSRVADILDKVENLEYPRLSHQDSAFLDSPPQKKTL